MITLRTVATLLLLGACAPPQGTFDTHQLDVWTLTVYRPDRLAEEAHVVYLFDGDDWSVDLAHVVDDLDEPPLVVGIGYGDGPNERERDYTPDREVEAFYGFLEDQLVPWVDAEYPTAATASERTVLGHSFGGAAAAYGLLAAHDTFGNAVAISPSLTRGEGALFDLEAAYAVDHDDLPARAWLGAGSLEAYGMAGLTEAMGQTLDGRGYPSLAVRTELLPNRVHTDVFAPAAELGLRFVLEAP